MVSIKDALLAQVGSLLSQGTTMPVIPGIAPLLGIGPLRLFTTSRKMSDQLRLAFVANNYFLAVHYGSKTFQSTKLKMRAVYPQCGLVPHRLSVDEGSNSI